MTKIMIKEMDLTEDDIADLIKKIYPHKKYHLTYCVQKFPEKIGLLGEHYTLNTTLKDLENKEKVHKTFFVKCFPEIQEQAELADGVGAFKKEIFIYELFEKFKQHSLKLISSCTPLLFDCRYNKYLILENLGASLYEGIDKMRFLEYNEVLIVIQQLAKLHASSIVYEEEMSKKLENIYNLFDEYREELEESFFNDREGFINHAGVNASIRGVLGEISLFNFEEKLASGKQFLDVAKTMLYKVYDLVKPSTKYRNVITHGDLWATNFLIKYDEKNEPVDCKFVDFQCSRYVPPAQDVLSFIYLTTSREFREKHLYQLLGLYYNYLDKNLKSNGVLTDSIINFPDFLDSCEEQKIFAIIQTAIYFPLILINSSCIESYLKDKDLHKKALFEDRTHLILVHKDKDRAYTKRLKDSILDLKRICEYI
ncbi:unnamed protein product [Brassicogethes aeneus]|uniref:CHK kinase-like domain-containing protein n=1 Tax=Brassicogethes aeneus TaxID=1431903 RepID=A0A9P0B7G0_BRAAE|nr:unnamed protein product [Brassicogethes aeneus]